MDLSRRQFLEITGVAATTVALPDWLRAPVPRPDVPWRALSPAQMPAPDLPALLLSRAAFGATTSEVERVRQIGPDAWIEEQLDYATIDNSAVEGRLRQELPTLAMTPRDLLLVEPRDNVAPQQLRLATLYRMVYDPRQLYEVMVEFWSDHFAIYHLDGVCDRLKTVDDRDVIRFHALGKFRDLLLASARSPAMLNFLNNDVSTRQKPNENYARELMELHTMGVAVEGKPYTETDVKEVAKCFTGWTWERRQARANYGAYSYLDSQHAQEAKTVLGQAIPPGLGPQDGIMVADILCRHPSTPQFLAAKLVRRFVTDDPVGQTPDLVRRVAEAYTRTDGDIKEMVSTILRSREFAGSFGSYGGRFSRPQDLFARAFRALDVPSSQFSLDIRGRVYANLLTSLAMLGHIPFLWLTPDGYPDVKQAWGGSSGLLTRWNVGLALAGAAPGGAQFVPGFAPAAQTPGAVATAGEAVDYWAERLLHRQMLPGDRDLVVDYLANGAGAAAPIAAVRQRLPETIALILDSPYFQWR